MKICIVWRITQHQHGLNTPTYIGNQDVCAYSLHIRTQKWWSRKFRFWNLAIHMARITASRWVSRSAACIVGRLRRFLYLKQCSIKLVDRGSCTIRRPLYLGCAGGWLDHDRQVLIYSPVNMYPRQDAFDKEYARLSDNTARCYDDSQKKKEIKIIKNLWTIIWL